MQFEELEEKLIFHNNEIERITQLYRTHYKGRPVKMVQGKYKGRIAQLDGVIPWNGGLAFLCMVQRVDGTGALNSDAHTRSYLTRDYFEFI